MHISSKLALAVAAVPLASAGVIRRANGYENALYWGAGNNQGTLADHCASGQGVDIVILAFLANFGNGAYPNGGFGDCSINADQSYSSECAQVAKDIQTCKDNGIKVFVSIGGADSNWGINGDGDAKGIAYSLWNSYANPSAVAANTPRPFGDVFIDGWDFDIESQGGDSYKYLGTLVNTLRGYFSSDSGNKYYIGGAPQCPLPEENMGLAMSQAQFDYLWVQFYNNNCAANDLFEDSNNNPDGAASYNLGDWPSYLSGGASADAKLLTGLPGAPDAAASFDYVDPSNLKSLVSQSKGVANWGGIMVYDAGASNEINDNGKNYAQLTKAALNSA